MTHFEARRLFDPLIEVEPQRGEGVGDFLGLTLDDVPVVFGLSAEGTVVILPLFTSEHDFACGVYASEELRNGFACGRFKPFIRLCMAAPVDVGRLFRVKVSSSTPVFNGPFVVAVEY